ncbi:uncharacterized protein KY384_009246 [Bacidia gigantensis]|uniref:uncharacterized protein n=1 Tax=Bacidia gigantensis TaxID=2732470 RepID=UPI001D045CD3|nr:uncharacterized protein KY384_009246 [Bacidia gigantensis]KAG8525602.1 hypothetical protein KY384_009246 [Bacidia gigantensis]
MSAAVLPSKSCLIAVLLVVQTTSEPRLVFQYPPKPEEDNTRFHELLAKINRSDESSSSSEDDEASSSDEKGSTKNDKVDVRENHSPPELDETGSASPSKRTEGHDNDVDTEEVRIFGYPPNVLAKVLCPSASSHRKKTEIGLDGKVFVGQPMFVGADGSWRKRKTRASFGKSVATDSGLGPLSTDSVPLHQMETNEIEISEIEEGDMEDDEHMARAKSDDDQAWNDGPAESLNISTKTEKAVNMFHVSFVLRPAPLEFHQRVKDIYHNIVKPFANDLRYVEIRLLLAFLESLC